MEILASLLAGVCHWLNAYVWIWTRSSVEPFVYAPVLLILSTLHEHTQQCVEALHGSFALGPLFSVWLFQKRFSETVACLIFSAPDNQIFMSGSEPQSYLRHAWL